MRKWVATGGSYTFEIVESEGFYDITVRSFMGQDLYWAKTLPAAKQFLKREFEGIEFTRFKEVT